MKDITTSFNFNANDITNVGIERLATDPSTVDSFISRIYYNTTTNRVRIYENTLAWADLDKSLPNHGTTVTDVGRGIYIVDATQHAGYLLPHATGNGERRILGIRDVTGGGFIINVPVGDTIDGVLNGSITITADISILIINTGVGKWSSNHVTSTSTPSTGDSVLIYPTYDDIPGANGPGTGIEHVLYITEDTKIPYYWTPANGYTEFVTNKELYTNRLDVLPDSQARSYQGNNALSDRYLSSKGVVNTIQKNIINAEVPQLLNTSTYLTTSQHGIRKALDANWYVHEGSPFNGYEDGSQLQRYTTPVLHQLHTFDEGGFGLILPAGSQSFDRISFALDPRGGPCTITAPAGELINNLQSVQLTDWGVYEFIKMDIYPQWVVRL